MQSDVVIRAHMTLCSVHWPSPLKSKPERRVMKSGTWQDEARETNAFTILDKLQVRTSDPVLPFGHTVLQFPDCQRPLAKPTLSRYRVRCDRQGQETQTPRAPRTGSAREAERAQNKIAVVHNMQGVLKCLTSCQEKVPGFVSGTNPA